MYGCWVLGSSHAHGMVLEGTEVMKNTRKNIIVLSFTVTIIKRSFLWSPPQFIADVAIQVLRKSLHKWQLYYHIFVCPKLVTQMWIKNIFRTCYLSFYVDVIFPHWNSYIYESLLILMYLPLLHLPPWTYRRSNSDLEMERLLHKVKSSKDRSQGSILREFIKLTSKLP